MIPNRMKNTSRKAAPSDDLKAKFQSSASMASMQCSKPAEASSQQQKHDQDHSFGHKVSEMIKGVFKGHHHGQAPAAHAPEGKEEHTKKDGNLLHKIKDKFSDHSSNSSDSDDDGHKAHHKRKN